MPACDLCFASLAAIFMCMKEKMYSNKFIYGALFVVAVVIGLCCGVAAGFLFFGLFHLFMWVNLSVNNFCNALLYRDDPNGFKSVDGTYRLLCIAVAAVCLAVAL